MTATPFAGGKEVVPEICFTEYTNEANIGFCGNFTARDNCYWLLYGHLYLSNPSSGKQDNTCEWCHRPPLHLELLPKL